jgi:pyruvate dehydrogenase E1 component alpha subunit
MGTSVGRSTAQTELFRKAEAHGMTAERVDGMDVLAVREVADRAIRRMRKQGKPHFLEAMCYRFVGHGVADNPQQQRFYRAEEEIEGWKARDPIKALWQRLERDRMVTAEQAAEIDAGIQREIEEAVAFAESSPEPPLDSLYENVFS